MKIKAISLLFPIFAVFVLSGETIACWSAPPSDLVTNLKEYNQFVRDYNNSEVIFSGKVIENDKFRLKFAIDKVWKGNLGKEFIMSTGSFPREKGGVSTRYSCAFSFELGKTYLVFAGKSPYFSFGPFGGFSNRYGEVLPEYRTLLYASRTGRTKLLSEAELGIKSLEELVKSKLPKFNPSRKLKTYRYPKPLNNRRASF